MKGLGKKFFDHTGGLAISAIEVKGAIFHGAITILFPSNTVGS